MAKVHQRIAPDIWIEKERDENLLPTDPSKGKYIFKLVTKAFKIIHFEADFTGT